MLDADKYLGSIRYAVSKVARRFGRLNEFDDAFQAAYLYCREYAPKYKPPRVKDVEAGPSAYMKMCARTAALRYFYAHHFNHDKETVTEVVIDGEGVAALDFAQSVDDNPEEKMLRDEQRLVLTEAMAFVVKKYGPAIAETLQESLLDPESVDWGQVATQRGRDRYLVLVDNRDALKDLLDYIQNRGHTTVDSESLKTSTTGSLSSEKIATIRQLRADGYSQRAVAKMMGVQQCIVNRYAKGFNSNRRRNTIKGPKVSSKEFAQHRRDLKQSQKSQGEVHERIDSGADRESSGIKPEGQG
jgi:predicted transcriptional regulator